MSNTLEKIEQSDFDKQYKARIKTLYQEHYQKLLRHIMNKGLTSREAEDIAQEAFVKLLGLDQPSIESYIQAYLYKIATNLSIDKLRRQARSPISYANEQHSDLTDARTPEKINQSRQQVKDIERRLMKLPLKCRQAFVLYKFKGMGYGDIAQLMCITESMVRKYVLQAVRACYQGMAK